jgi:prophage DNA circulation protein
MILDNLQQGSYRGVPFLIGDVTTDEGRKTVTHEYPNTDRREVEDLGLLQGIFSITGLVKTQEDFKLRDRLREALNAPGSGELVHPFFGTVTVTAKPFSLTENTRELGIARFTMTFEVSQDPIFPAQTSVKTSLIKSLSDILLGSINSDIVDTFNVARASVTNYKAALVKLQSIGDKFSSIGRSVSAVTGNISSFSATVTSFTSGITSNIFSPSALADSISDTFLQFDTLGADVKSQFNLAKQLFGFGDDDPIIETTTVARQEKADNQLILNSAMRASAIALAYNNAANITYENELELLEVRQSLEDEYKAITEDTNLSGDTLDALQELRNVSREFFEDVSVTVSKIRNITVNTIPMSILAYDYYGNTDNTEALIELNDTRDVSFVSGSLQILTP